MRILFLPFSLIYKVIIFIRNKLYDFKLLKISSVDAKVISVGNISTGGTGKTPMTQYLAEYFLRGNKSVVIITKGYKRTHEDIQIAEIGYENTNNKLTVEKFGDESLLLLENLADINVKPGKGLLLVSDDKTAGIRFADKKFKPEIIIIDDAFQLRNIRRDLDIVMLNPSPFWQSGLLIPAGNMREPLRNIRRADVLVLNKKFDGLDSTKFQNKKEPGLVISNYKLENFINAKGEALNINGIKKYTNGSVCVIAFCGIADPESFKKLLHNHGIHPDNFIKFPDHHNFKVEDIRQILNIFEKNSKSSLLGITTQKDMIRLKYSNISHHEATKKLLFDCPLYYAKIKLQIIDKQNEVFLYEHLNKFI